MYMNQWLNVFDMLEIKATYNLQTKCKQAQIHMKYANSK